MNKAANSRLVDDAIHQHFRLEFLLNPLSLNLLYESSFELESPLTCSSYFHHIHFADVTVKNRG